MSDHRRVAESGPASLATFDRFPTAYRSAAIGPTPPDGQINSPYPQAD